MEVSQKLQLYYLSNFPVEAAAQLNKISSQEIIELIKTLNLDDIKGALSRLHTERLAEISEHISIDSFVAFLQEASSEKITKVLHSLSDEKKEQVFQRLPKSLRKDIKELMMYPIGTAGAIMDPQILRMSPKLSAEEAIARLKEKNRRGIRVLFLVNENDELHSMVSIQQLVMADDSTKLENISKPIPCILTDMTLQDEIVEKLGEHKMTDLPVVDINNQFIGVVRNHSIIKATKEELTKDIQTMVGVSEDERALSKVSFAVRKRLPWLEINLLTAFLAAAVVGLFENTIAKYTALAVLLPVVAGQSGNTGAQALAVTMRGLALKEIRTSHWFVLLFKELRISLFTGVAVALTTAIGVLIWSKSLGLTLIIGVSMILSMMLASISGAAVPLVLARLGQDPASSSSILLTTVTDVCGFFSFLGIATALAHLI